MDHAEIIRRYIVDEFVYSEEDARRLTTDASLLAEGVLDSVGILSVITFLTETFGIHIENDEVVPDNLESIDAMAAFVARKRAVTRAAA
ncbi:MAG: acyl carrier protein [Candidatus Latescibacterota bacterium]